MLASVLRVEDVTIRLGQNDVVRGVSFELPATSSLAIVGRSGAGKSTLLSAILGLTRIRSGGISVAGRSVVGMNRRDMNRMRRHDVGIVFQSGELMPELNALENVMVAALVAGVGADEARARAAALLDQLDVPIAGPTAGELSGGERQRVAIARALVNEPSLVIADEPTGSLDTELRDSTCDVLYSIPQGRGAALLVVTHDPAVAARADQIVRMTDGRVLRDLEQA